jgi:hypothetical protein
MVTFESPMQLKLRLRRQDGKHTAPRSMAYLYEIGGGRRGKIAKYLPASASCIPLVLSFIWSRKAAPWRRCTLSSPVVSTAQWRATGRIRQPPPPQQAPQGACTSSRKRVPNFTAAAW